MPESANEFVVALSALTRAGVRFVIVGVGGINFYATDPSLAVATLDLDTLLAPDAQELRRALAALGAAGFTFEAGGEPFVDFEDAEALAGLLRSQATVTCHGPSGSQLDLMLSITGATYEDLDADGVPFTLGDVEVRVGRLEKLLRSKELSGRPKDIEFLRLYVARFRNHKP